MKEKQSPVNKLGQEENIISKLSFPTIVEGKEVNSIMRQIWCLLCKKMGLIPVLQHAETYKLKYYKLKKNYKINQTKTRWTCE